MSTGDKPLFEEQTAFVPFFSHEAEQTRNERTIKRLICALVIAIILLFLNNAIWFWAWVQYDYSSEEKTTTETVTVDGKDGIANYIGNNGDITNGENSSTKNKNNTDTNSDTQE